MKILLSIKPEYANKILTGEKKFEFRKVGFSHNNIEAVVIYATKPIGKVIGEFTVTQVHQDQPSKIWELTKKHAGIDKNFFDDYYQDKQLAYAIGVGKVIRYENPITLEELKPGLTAPQSFRYLPTSTSSQTQLELIK